MKTLMIILVALTTVWATGCEHVTEQDPWEIDKCKDDCEEDPRESPKLDGTYISGHLGNYDSCPDDGYSAEGNTESSEPASGDFAAGACAEGEDCSSLQACEDGQITVRLRNTGEEDARGLQITTLNLFDAEGQLRATLPLIAAVETDTNEPFDGTLAADKEVTLRVEFQGPANPYSLLQPASGASGDRSMGSSYGTLEVTVSGENHDDVVVESTELYPVPSVAT
jgi:hypothetical protein